MIFLLKFFVKEEGVGGIFPSPLWKCMNILFKHTLFFFNVIGTVKSNLRSCLASCEALDSCLIPSIFTVHSEQHSKLLEEHWWEEITYFRRCVQDIIDSDAFCVSLIDKLSDTIKELNQTFDLDVVKRSLIWCDVLYEHLQLNYTELKLHVESPAKLHYDDFKMMLNECKAILKSNESIDNERITKRLRILRSVLKKFESTLNVKGKEDQPDAMGVAKEPSSFTFGNLTQLSQHDLAKPLVDEHKLSDSLVVAIDMDEFLKSFEAKIPQRNSVFYQSKRRRARPKSPCTINKTLSPNLRKDINAPKRSSKSERF